MVRVLCLDGLRKGKWKHKRDLWGRVGWWGGWVLVGLLASSKWNYILNSGDMLVDL